MATAAGRIGDTRKYQASCRNTGEQGHRDTASHGHIVAGSQGHKVTGSQGHRVTVPQGHRVRGSQGQRVRRSEDHGCEATTGATARVMRSDNEEMRPTFVNLGHFLMKATIASCPAWKTHRNSATYKLVGFDYGPTTRNPLGFHKEPTRIPPAV